MPSGCLFYDVVSDYKVPNVRKTAIWYVGDNWHEILAQSKEYPGTKHGSQNSWYFGQYSNQED
jgi:hypothetical protein